MPQKADPKDIAPGEVGRVAPRKECHGREFKPSAHLWHLGARRRRD